MRDFLTKKKAQLNKAIRMPGRYFVFDDKVHRHAIGVMSEHALVTVRIKSRNFHINIFRLAIGLAQYIFSE